MPKPEKVAAVQELSERLREAPAALLAEFRGLKVQEMKELRRTLAGAGAEFRVVKNTLARLAAREAKLDDLLPLLEGSTGIAFVRGDPIEAAKGLDEFAKKYPALVVKGGLLERRVLGADEASELAKVKPREVLLAELAGLLQSPLQRLMLVLSAPLRNLGYALAARREALEPQGGDTTSGPAAESPAAPEATEAAAAQEGAETAAKPEAAETAAEPHGS
ncbi:MAG: 50S ribosomal protein L10 [Gaiellales bacterium]